MLLLSVHLILKIEQVTCSSKSYCQIDCMGFAWQGFGSAGGYRVGFSDTMPEASPISNRTKASWLQDTPTTGQGQAHQQWWQSLCDNIFKQGKKPAAQLQPQRGVRTHDRNNSADTQVQ